MTKKELIENIDDLSDDAEIVFATNEKTSCCIPMTPLALSEVRGNGKIFLVVDAIPYWYLKERYGVSLSDTDKKQD